MTHEQKALDAASRYGMDDAKQAQKRHGLTDIATAMYFEAAENGYLSGHADAMEECEAEIKILEGLLKEREAEIEAKDERINDLHEKLDAVRANEEHQGEMIRTRDDKIAALKRDCQTLEWAVAEEGALRMAVESNNATLRQKLAEAEETSDRLEWEVAQLEEAE